MGKLTSRFQLHILACYYQEQQRGCMQSAMKGKQGLAEVKFDCIPPHNQLHGTRPHKNLSSYKRLSSPCGKRLFSFERVVISLTTAKCLRTFPALSEQKTIVVHTYVSLYKRRHKCFTQCRSTAGDCKTAQVNAMVGVLHQSFWGLLTQKADNLQAGLPFVCCVFQST